MEEINLNDIDVNFFNSKKIYEIKKRLVSEKYLLIICGPTASGKSHTALFLAKLFGLYFIIVGVVVLVRRRAMMPTVTSLLANRAMLLVLGAVEIIAGLAIVLTYPQISFDIRGILSVIGYMMIVEGIIYLAAPVKMVQKMIRKFNRPSWYLSGGLLAVLLGVYLAAVGFGFWVM